MDWSRWLGDIEGVMDFFFPSQCLLCHSPGKELFCGALCPSCLQGCPPLHSPRCPCCALPFATIGGGDHLCGECLLHPPDFSLTVAAGLYEETLRSAIHRFKFDGLLSLDRPLTHLLDRAWQRKAAAWTPDLILPVPLHPSRLRQRTYNQALLIARELGRQQKVTVDPSLLIRLLPTVAQVGLSAPARQKNLCGAFALTRRLSGERVLLVDDVMTTGTTARICATTLLSGGAGEVAIAVLARARRNSLLGAGEIGQELISELRDLKGGPSI